jgi:transposase
MEHIAGVDLHARNGYYGIIEEDGKRVLGKRLPNDLPTIVATLDPYKETLTSIVIESTYNWYWLADGLMKEGYPVELANPAGFKRYKGLKHSDDKTDAFFLTELKRLGILPSGYIYPKEQRSVRDVLRRRMLLVQQRTSHILSIQSLIMRQTGKEINNKQIRIMTEAELETLLGDRHLMLAAKTGREMINFLTERIARIEQAVESVVHLRPEYEKLQTVPGIGKILALTIMLETGAIGRFASTGNYASYCRCVKSDYLSDGKKKGEGNRKNGNKYLGWAFVEAANYGRRWYPEVQKYYQRKQSKTNQVIATKALACKLCKACYYIMRDQVVFDMQKVFG